MATAERPLFRTTEPRPQHPGVVLIRYTRLLAGWGFAVLMGSITILVSILGMRRLAWITLPRLWSRGSLLLCGVHLNVVGREGLVGPAIFTSNHHSFIDIVFVPSLLPRRSRYVVKKELREIPVWGWAAGDGLITLDRKKAGQGGELVKDLQRGVEALPEGWSISIYPEGTRSATGAMGQLRKGIFHVAMASRLPIIPIGSWGAAGIVPLRTFLVRSGPIEVTVGDPIETSHWQPEDFDDKMAEIRAALTAVTEASRQRYEEKYEVCEPHRYAGSMIEELMGTRPRA